MTKTPHDLIHRVERLWQVLCQPPKQRPGYATRIRNRISYQFRRQQIERVFCRLDARGIVVYLPTFGGDFELPLANKMTRRLILGGYEPTQQSIFRAILQPGDHMIDIGANLGLFTVLAGTLVGPSGLVLAVEPVPSMVNNLQQNIRRNQLTNVRIFEGVAADIPKTFQLHTSEGAEEYSSLQQIAHPDASRNNPITLETPGLPIDQLVSEHQMMPGVLKVDTEGAEGLVLSGASTTLATHRPILISELDDRLLRGFDWSSGKVIRLLNDAGYIVIDQKSHKSITSATANFVGDIIGIPEEARKSLST